MAGRSRLRHDPGHRYHRTPARRPLRAGARLLPLLGPLSFLPLPARFHVDFGEPLTFEGPFDDEDEAIDTKVAVVRERIQQMVDDSRSRRLGVFS